MGVRSQKSQAEYRDLRHSSPFNNLWVANYLEYFPGGTSVVKTLPSSAGGQVQSLIGKLRPHMLCGMTKK